MTTECMCRCRYAFLPRPAYYKRWQRRWFVLVRSADALFYFKREHVRQEKCVNMCATVRRLI